MKFVLTNAAQADLAGIWDYTVQTWGEAQARSYTLKIKQTCHALCSDMYPNRSAEDVRPGYRRALVGRHTIFFRSNETEIQIIRILHQSMDVDSQFG